MFYKSYKYRLKPTKEQAAMIESAFSARRFIWNAFLERISKAYKRRGETLSMFDCTKLLTEMKQYCPWLKQYDVHMLRFAIKDLIAARKKFFENCKKGIRPAGYPRFKNKKNLKQSFTTDGTIHVTADYIQIPKIGRIRYRCSRPCEGIPKAVTISRDDRRRYWISVCCAVDIQPLPVSPNQIGLDVGLAEFATDSNGVVYDNPKFLKKSEKKLIREQRKLSRKMEGSASWKKQKTKVAKVHEKIRNQRNTFQHQLSRKLVDENQVIAVEDLAVKNMLKNRHLAKAVADAGWSGFIEKLAYKSLWAGRDFIKIPRYYASSQICSCCGHQHTAVKNLAVRQWICPVCGAFHQRDINAAINILAKGQELLSA